MHHLGSTAVSLLPWSPIWRGEVSFTVSSQRLGREETALSRVQHLHCCFLDGFQKWGTMGLDPERCSRNLHLRLWAQRSSHSQYEELQLVSAGISGLWCLPCTYHSFTDQVWEQHNGNYSSWTIWFSTPQENPISAEDASMVPYISCWQTFYCSRPWGHCNSWSPGSLFSEIWHSGTLIVDLFYNFYCSL